MGVNRKDCETIEAVNEKKKILEKYLHGLPLSTEERNTDIYNELRLYVSDSILTDKKVIASLIDLCSIRVKNIIVVISATLVMYRKASEKDAHLMLHQVCSHYYHQNLLLLHAMGLTGKQARLPL